MKGSPLPAGLAVFHQEMWAVLVRGIPTLPWPMIVRNHVFQWDIMALHQHSRKLRRPLHRRRKIRSSVLAHLDPDRIPIPWSVEVRVLTLLGGGHVLDRYLIVHREMPDQVADTVTPSSLR